MEGKPRSPFWKRRGQVPTAARETAPARPMFPGRPQYTGNWEPGVVSKPLHHRNWTANSFGINGAVSNVPAGRWHRGTIFRHEAPQMMPPAPGFWMYDPTSLVAIPGFPDRRR